MTEEEFFDSAFKDKGGRFEFEHLDEEYLGIYDLFKKRAINYIEKYRDDFRLTKSFPTILFDYIDNPGLGASAGKLNDVFLIGIYRGTIIILRDLFFRMLSNPDILNNIGDASVEIKGAVSLKNYYCNANMLIISQDGKEFTYKPIVPKNSVRRDYAQHLMELAFDFLISHELNHILNGHIDYIKMHYGFSAYHESDSFNGDIDKVLTLQTLEMDADCIAVSREIDNINENFFKNSLDEKGLPFYDSFDDSIFDWLLATLTLLRIMVESSIYKGVLVNYDKHEYPHPRVRQVMLIDTANEHLKKQDSKLSEDDVIKAIDIIELTYTFITGNTINKDDEQTIYNGNMYVKKVLYRWKEIRVELQEKAYTLIHR